MVLLVVLTAHVERFSVSHMRDFYPSGLVLGLFNGVFLKVKIPTNNSVLGLLWRGYDILLCILCRPACQGRGGAQGRCQKEGLGQKGGGEAGRREEGLLEGPYTRQGGD